MVWGPPAEFNFLDLRTLTTELGRTWISHSIQVKGGAFIGCRARGTWFPTGAHPWVRTASVGFSLCALPDGGRAVGIVLPGRERAAGIW